MSSTRVILIIVAVIVVALAVVFSFFRKSDDSGTTIVFSEVLEAGRDGRLESVVVAGQNLDVKLREDETLYESTVGHDTDVAAVFVQSGIQLGEPEGARLEFEKASSADAWVSLLIAFAPLLVFGVLLYFAVYWGVRRAMRERSPTQPDF